MLAMFVTLDVSRPERSSDVRPEQPENMEAMFVTFAVENAEGNVMLVSDEQP